jgi:hypothetical protein
LKNPFYYLFIFIALPAFIVQAQSDVFRKEVENTGNALLLEAPREQNPVAVNTLLVKDKSSDMMAVIIKVHIMTGWHIYSIVPATHHYINTEFILELPTGVEKAGDWIKAESRTSEEKGVYIYENEGIFIHYLKAADNQDHERVIETGLYYQCCNYSVCKPPAERLFKLKI